MALSDGVNRRQERQSAEDRDARLLVALGTRLDGLFQEFVQLARQRDVRFTRNGWYNSQDGSYTFLTPGGWRLGFSHLGDRDRDHFLSHCDLYIMPTGSLEIWEDFEFKRASYGSAASALTADGYSSPLLNILRRLAQKRINNGYAGGIPSEASVIIPIYEILAEDLVAFMLDHENGDGGHFDPRE